MVTGVAASYTAPNGSASISGVVGATNLILDSTNSFPIVLRVEP